ncbi:MAG TPA: SagB/ThcOx family dehydrogenase [Candidatus Binatia bacterium]|nr:SagB/ThcOx family dehydrogenase [Candidatus Binatia bacterium]
MPGGDPAALRAYHEATKHSPASVYGARHTLDWGIMPRPFKVYPDLEPIALPRDFESSTRPALAALADPGATGDGPPLDRAALARLLFFSAGIVRTRRYPGGEIHFRAAACTGALYHVDLYLVCGALADLDAGVYHFGPHDFALRRLRPGDHRGAVVAATAAEPAVAAAPVLVLFATTFWRNAWKYRARAYRHAFWDSGTILANLLAVAAATGVPARVVLGFVDGALDALLDLEPMREATLGVVALGRGGPPAPAPPHAPPLALATLPPSAREVDYPAIRDAHRAAALADADAVAAWRGTLPPGPLAPAAAPGTPLPPARPDAVREPIERVVLRRGSARAFAESPIALAELGAILDVATRGFSADFAAPARPLADAYVIVHAVDGVPPGAYVHDRARATLVPLRAGSFRREAGHLALGQALAAAAAADVFWLADLERVLARFGARGYRAAQLAAAVEGGRAYLAAYALGLGATGLTFFDDDVTAFFSPHAAGKSVLFLLAVGHPRRGR